MDKYRIDNHKLMYHVPRVNDWLKGELVYPIYMEISPTGACNHRCTYCGLDFMKYRKDYLDSKLFKERISELGRLGVKSVMYAGEGEPFLHPDMAEFIGHTQKSGIQAGLTTNGVLFSKERVDETLGDVAWIKVSIDGATKDTYARIHRSSPEDFDCVINNMKYASKVRKSNNYKCTLGMQLLLLPENCHEAIDLAKLSRDIGMDYLVVKPYSQHPQSKTTRYSSLKYADYEYLESEFSKINTDDFNVIFRIDTMKEWDRGQTVRGYDCCLATSFWAYIDARGNVWGCSIYLENEKFLYGNIYKQSFQKIWEGEKRKKVVTWIENELDISECRVNCRMNRINKYLWDLKNLPEHVNFI